MSLKKSPLDDSEGQIDLSFFCGQGGKKMLLQVEAVLIVILIF